MLPVTTNRPETVAEIIAEMRSGGLEAWEAPADGVYANRCADRIEAALKRVPGHKRCDCETQSGNYDRVDICCECGGYLP